jgi:hypothetical protein
MLNIDQKPKFTADIAVALPGEQPQNFTAKFNVIPINEMAGFEFVKGEDTAAFLRAALDAVYDVVDTAGSPLVLTPHLTHQLINQPHIRQALLRGYFEGLEKAAKGN